MPFEADIATAFEAAARRVRYAADAETDAHAAVGDPIGFEYHVRDDEGRVAATFKADTPRGVVADHLDDRGRATEAVKLRKPGMVAVDRKGHIRRGVYSSRDVETAARRVYDHLDEWSGGQYEPRHIEIDPHLEADQFHDGELPVEAEDETPDHVTVAHRDDYDEPSVHRVHYRDLGSHIADAIDGDVNRADWGWNTDGNATADHSDIGISDELNMLPLNSHNSRWLARLADNDSLDHDELGRAESEATRLAEQWHDQAHSLEDHDDHDEDAVRELFQNAEAARTVAFQINRHRNEMSRQQVDHGAEFDRLLQQLREAPHVVADPADTDED